MIRAQSFIRKEKESNISFSCVVRIADIKRKATIESSKGGEEVTTKIQEVLETEHKERICVYASSLQGKTCIGDVIGIRGKVKFSRGGTYLIAEHFEPIKGGEYHATTETAARIDSSAGWNPDTEYCDLPY